METKSNQYKFRLGLFALSGILLFCIAVFIIGKQKNLFNPVFRLSTFFHNVSGLQIGNNILFSGIVIGTVDNILLINDSIVRVDMIVKKEVQPFIRKNYTVSIGSSGIIGDRTLVIEQTSPETPNVKNGDILASNEPIETAAIMQNLNDASFNAVVISAQLSEILIKINSGNGTLGRLIQDSSIAENIDQTILNLRNSSKGLDENMEAVKHNIFLKGYYDKKKKAEEKRRELLLKK